MTCRHSGDPLSRNAAVPLKSAREPEASCARRQNDLSTDGTASFSPVSYRLTDAGGRLLEWSLPAGFLLTQTCSVGWEVPHPVAQIPATKAQLDGGETSKTNRQHVYV